MKVPVTIVFQTSDELAALLPSVLPPGPVDLTREESEEIAPILMKEEDARTDDESDRMVRILAGAMIRARHRPGMN